MPNKRIDLLVNAFNKLGLPLIIIGDGPERNSLEKIAKPNIKFLKKLSNSAVEIIWEMQGICLCWPRKILVLHQ